jgi:hypothetical protein
MQNKPIIFSVSDSFFIYYIFKLNIKPQNSTLLLYTKGMKNTFLLHFLCEKLKNKYFCTNLKSYEFGQKHH